VALCAVYIVHVEMKSIGFLVEPQNQGLRFVSGFASKSLGCFSPVWPQNRQLRFGDLGIKTKQVLVCRLCHKTDGGRTARDMRRDLVAYFT
jgi:hypothetical protein